MASKLRKSVGADTGFCRGALPTYLPLKRPVWPGRSRWRCAVSGASCNVGLNLLLMPRYGMWARPFSSTLQVWLALAYRYFVSRLRIPAPLPPLRGPAFGGGAMAMSLWLTPTCIGYRAR